MASAAAPDQLTYADDVLGLAQWHNLHLMFLAGALRPEHLAVMERSHRDLLARQPSGVASLTVFAANSPVTGPEMRRRSAESFKDLGPTLIRSTVVIEGNGVWAAMARTLLRGIGMLTRRTDCFHVFGTVEDGLSDALPFVKPRDGRPPRPAEVPALLSQLRQRVARLQRRAEAGGIDVLPPPL